MDTALTRHCQLKCQLISTALDGPVTIVWRASRGTHRRRIEPRHRRHLYWMPQPDCTLYRRESLSLRQVLKIFLREVSIPRTRQCMMSVTILGLWVRLRRRRVIDRRQPPEIHLFRGEVRYFEPLQQPHLRMHAQYPCHSAHMSAQRPHSDPGDSLAAAQHCRDSLTQRLTDSSNFANVLSNLWQAQLKQASTPYRRLGVQPRDRQGTFSKALG